MTPTLKEPGFGESLTADEYYAQIRAAWNVLRDPTPDYLSNSNLRIEMPFSDPTDSRYLFSLRLILTTQIVAIPDVNSNVEGVNIERLPPGQWSVDPSGRIETFSAIRRILTFWDIRAPI